MDDLGFTVLIGTLALLVFLVLVVLLLVLNSNRRIRHRAEVAELQARQTEAVRTAEREMQQETLAQVGRELHDNIGQLLTAIRIGTLRWEGSGHDTERATGTKQMVDRTIAEVRRLSRTLDPDRWAELGLGQAIREECDRVTALGGPLVYYTEAGDGLTLTADIKVVLYRLFQEALNNALKHARATEVHVRLERGPGVRLEVRDNGRGMDTTKPADGMGLHNLDQRAKHIGYTARLTSAPGAGTTVTIQPA